MMSSYQTIVGDNKITAGWARQPSLPGSTMERRYSNFMQSLSGSRKLRRQSFARAVEHNTSLNHSRIVHHTQLSHSRLRTLSHASSQEQKATLPKLVACKRQKFLLSLHQSNCRPKPDASKPSLQLLGSIQQPTLRRKLRQPALHRLKLNQLLQKMNYERQQASLKEGVEGHSSFYYEKIKNYFESKYVP